MTDKTLPPLPATRYVLGIESDGYSPDKLTSEEAYTADQMREYARTALSAQKPLPEHWMTAELRDMPAAYQRAAREYAEDYARAAISAQKPQAETVTPFGDPAIDKAWGRFEAELERGQKQKAERVRALVNAGPFPGMSEAFDVHMGAACWTDPAYAPDASTWASAWKAALAAAPLAAKAPEEVLWDDLTLAQVKERLALLNADDLRGLVVSLMIDARITAKAMAATSAAPQAQPAEKPAEAVAWPIDGDAAKRIADKHCISYETLQLIARDIAAAQPQKAPQPLTEDARDAARLAFVYGNTSTESNALVELEIRCLNGEYPTLTEVRAAIDAAMSSGTKTGEADGGD